MLNHFSHSELACPTTDQVCFAAGFGEALERLRVELEEPIYLNSACRSPIHNAKVDGHPRSLDLVINSHWVVGGCCAVVFGVTAEQWPMIGNAVAAVAAAIAMFVSEANAK